MFRISKEFHFSASHNLSNLPEGHPCGQLHGHNYVVKVELAAETLDEYAFVIDYRELSAFRDHIDENFDHRHLNDVLGHDQTSSEILAKYFYDWCKQRWAQVSAVSVCETPKTWAEYRP